MASRDLASIQFTRAVGSLIVAVALTTAAAAQTPPFTPDPAAPAAATPAAPPTAPAVPAAPAPGRGPALSVGHRRLPRQRCRRDRCCGPHDRPNNKRPTPKRKPPGRSGAIRWSSKTAREFAGCGMPRRIADLFPLQYRRRAIARGTLPATVTGPHEGRRFRSLNGPTQVKRIGQAPAGRRNPACERTAPQEGRTA